MALCWGKWLSPRVPGQRLQGEKHRCQINTKCSFRLMLLLMRAQQDCPTRWVFLKRLCLPKSPTADVGVGKGMLPIREAQDCWSCQRYLASLETGALNLAELRTREKTLPDKECCGHQQAGLTAAGISAHTQSSACFGQAWALAASAVPITHALCDSCSISGR